MAKVKYDVTHVEDIPDMEMAPVGIYRLKIVSCEAGVSSKDNQMLTVRLHPTHDAAGKKLKTEYGDVWDYPILDHDHPFVQNKLKEFFRALGLKPKGILDTDKIVGKTVQAKLKSDTDQDGEYRPRIGKYMIVTAPEDEEPEEEEDAEDAEEEDGDEEEQSLEDALNELDRAGLKAFIKDQAETLTEEVKVLKKDSDDDLRAKIVAAWPDDEDAEDEEEDAEEEEEEDSDEEVDYDSMSPADLKAALKERELATTGSKKVLIQRLRKDDADSPF